MVILNRSFYNLDSSYRDIHIVRVHTCLNMRYTLCILFFSSHLCYTLSAHTLYKCVVRALALLDCLVTILGVSKRAGKF